MNHLSTFLQKTLMLIKPPTKAEPPAMSNEMMRFEFFSGIIYSEIITIIPTKIPVNKAILILPLII
jgi:hypothetical protein